MSEPTPGQQLGRTNRAVKLALACYPRWWREQRAAEVQGVLMDSVADRGRLDRQDLLNLAAHGLRTRFASADGTALTAIRDRTALLAAASGFAACVVLLLFAEWGLGVPTPAPSRDLTIGAPVYLLWLLAIVLAVSGRGRTGRLLLGLAGLAALVAPALAAATDHLRPPQYVTFLLALVSALGATGRLAPDPRARRRLLLLSVSCTVAATLTILLWVGTLSYSDGLYHAYEQYNCSFFPLAAVGAALVLLIAGHRAWSAALVVNGAVWMSLVRLLPSPGERHGLEVTIGLALLMGVLAGGVVVLRHRRLQRAPRGLLS